MSTQSQQRDQDEYVLVRRTRIAALSRALGNPTTVNALEGDTVEDCLLEMAAQRLNTQGQNVMPHGIAHLLPPFTLTGHQLRWALMMANPDGASDPEQLDAAVSLQSKLPGKNVDGEDMPAGLYCWLHEYPEEGSICVDGPWVFGPDDFNFHRHLARQRAFSEQTFGPGMRTQGVIDHIRKELLEIEAAPTDLSEWIDVAILALDGAWRTGATPQQIIEALVAKQAKNEARQWPDWRTVPAGQAIEHVRAEPSGPLKDCNGPVARHASAAEDAMLGEMFRAWHELRGLGWLEMFGYPDDGTVVEVITAGSTGVHDAKVMNGSWWVLFANDLWPAHPILWRPKKQAPGGAAA